MFSHALGRAVFVFASREVKKLVAAGFSVVPATWLCAILLMLMPGMPALSAATINTFFQRTYKVLDFKDVGFPDAMLWNALDMGGAASHR